YVGTVLLIRNAMTQHLSKPNWLDGAVAGLGAATVCAAFAFHSLLGQLGDTSGTVATNLSYPIGDLLVLSLVIGGTVVLSGRWSLPWLLLTAGITLNVVGDTFNLFQASEYSTRLGSTFNAIAWPTSILLIAMSVWLRPQVRDPLQVRRVAGFALPSLAAATGLAVLLVGTVESVSRVAIALATATLVVVGVRLALSARDLRLLTEERHRQAMTDELTGLSNRRHLFQVLQAYFSEPLDAGREQRRLAFLFIDLNHFKELNDSFGHQAGDEVLRELGPRLTRSLQGAGLVTRIGGDEFAVTLVDASRDDATTLAARILEELERPFVLQQTSVTVGASIGIALSPADADDATGLLWCADVAMYRAKLGGVAVAYFDAELDGDEDKLSVAHELRTAVEEGAFVLHYQPQLDLATGRIAGVEALIRWPHRELGLIPPLNFLGLAEEAGLMRPLTAWVLDTALAQCAAWREEGHELTMSVNVTTGNLLEDDFLDVVLLLLARHEVPASALIIEITETSIITDIDRSRSVIERLRDAGVTVSIDDFGAGFTSLAYLSGLAVGELKLDRSFITGIGAAGHDRELEVVRATIQLGHDVGLRVVAEGIEDEATLELLRELGCDLAQGYYVSLPMPGEHLSLGRRGEVVSRLVPVE
ncbi:MAG TPA: EAL domain-containing protein, partial [Acidimicrobiales bacterium]